VSEVRAARPTDARSLSWFRRYAEILGLLAFATAGIMSTEACSVLLDWTGYTGTGGGAGAEGGADGGGYLLTCGMNLRCAPAPPPGWTGPVAFGEVSNDAGTPTCGDSYSMAFKGSAGLEVPPAVCNCSCSVPTGATCPMPAVSFFSDSSCTAACGTPVTLSTSSCPDVPSGCSALQIASASPQGGSCSPTTNETFPPATWSRQSVECFPVPATSQGSCSAGNFCLPAPPASLAFCVSQPGVAAACPNGSSYNQGPFVEFSGVSMTESRRCSDCGCEPPTGATCDQPTGFSYISNCGIPTVPFSTPSACAPAGSSSPNGLPKANPLPLTVHGGQCAPTGGVPAGTVTPDDTPTSFCCAP
jgi:hypothetical protein